MYMWINKDLYLSNVKHQVFVSTSIYLAVLKRVLAKYCWLPILSCSEESGGLWSMESQSCSPWEHNLGTEQQQATPLPTQVFCKAMGLDPFIKRGLCYK